MPRATAFKPEPSVADKKVDICAIWVGGVNMTEARYTRVESSLDGHDRLRGQLVDTINHELRTPLAIVVCHTELLQDLDLPESAQHSLAAIARAGERLADMADFISFRIADLASGDPRWAAAHSSRAPRSH